MSDVIHTLATRSVVRDGVSGRTMRPYVLRGDAVQERVTATSYRVGGRPGADLVLADPRVSRLHFEISVDAHGYRLRDLGSTNGTVVDGYRANDLYLRPGSEITVGDTTLRFTPEDDEVDVPASPDDRFGPLVGASVAMRELFALLAKAAPTDATLLVEGESGTGKELVARAVHQASSRRDGPYVSENVSAIPDTLLESALFGHVRGAFTGAERARRGLFEVADGGSLFLDEIGEMSESMQAKLLRVLQDGQLRSVGSEETTTVDVRLIAATHRDLERMVEEGAFRQDLFYRVAVVQVELPPLRERLDDVAPLVAAFLDRHAPERRVRVDRGAMNALRAFSWPGNVRELENEIRRALVLADEIIGPEHLSPKVRGAETQAPADALDLKGQVAALERRLIVQALDQTAGNQTRAAELLGLSRYGLQKMMKRLDVPKP